MSSIYRRLEANIRVIIPNVKLMYYSKYTKLLVAKTVKNIDDYFGAGSECTVCFSIEGAPTRFLQNINFKNYQTSSTMLIE